MGCVYYGGMSDETGSEKKEYLTQAECARRLGAARTSVGRAARIGQLPYVPKRGIVWPDAKAAWAKRNETARGPGRPQTVLTASQLDELEKLAAVLTQEQIADFLGISRANLLEIIKRDDQVAKRYQRGRAAAIGKVGGGLLARALEGDTTSAIFYLKTQARWSERQEIEHTVRSPQEAAAAFASAMLGDDEED